MKYIDKIKQDLKFDCNLYYFLDIRSMSKYEKEKIQSILFLNNIFWASDKENTGYKFTGNSDDCNYYWICWSEFLRRIVLTQSSEFIDTFSEINFKKIDYYSFISNKIEKSQDNFIDDLFKDIV